MTVNIYVGNLSFQATADDLRILFAPYGTVTRAEVVTERGTGRSRGFAFVKMADGGGAAVAALDGAEVGGRPIAVREVVPREEPSLPADEGGSGDDYGYGGHRHLDEAGGPP